MIVYLILIYSVGFTVATMCYGIAMPLIAHYRKVKTVILFAIGMVLVILIGFGYFFKIPLPWDIITDNFNIFY
jgi:predicted RND superfamily exporter protein